MHALPFVENLVSVIIPVYNRSALVVDAAKSVLSQTYQPVECIVVDDGSVDDTPAILDALATRYPDQVRVIHKSNSGPGPSREQGLQLARGEFIQYLDSDDLLAPDKFAKQVEALRQVPGAALCYGITEYYRLGQERNKKIFAETDRPVDQIFPAFLRQRRWGTSTPLYRRSVVDQIGPWGELWAEEDWEYDCRIGALRLQVLHVHSLVSSQRGIVGQRLSQQGRNDRRTLASQAEARMRIYYSAKQAGVSADAPEMDLFLRSLFMLARDCGGVGLESACRRLLDIVEEEACISTSRCRAKLYRNLAEFVGWRRLSQAARIFERGRSFLRK